MDGVELNKIAAAVLLALLTGMISSKLASILLSPDTLAENVYIVEGVEDTGAQGVNIAATGPEPIEPLLASADVERGMNVAKKCLQCHTFEKGGPNKIGPNLYGIIGHKIAGVAGFAYSKAFQGLEGSWDFARMNELLYKPSTFARGTKMSFAGLKKVQDRADIVAYLNTLSDSPAALPAAVEKTEDVTEEVPGPQKSQEQS